MYLDGQSPLVPSLSDGIMAALAFTVVTTHLVVLINLLRDRRDLTHTIFFGLIVLYVPVAGPIGYLLWRGREPQKQVITTGNAH